MLSNAQEHVLERIGNKWGRCVVKPLDEPDAEGYQPHLIVGLLEDIDQEYVRVEVDGTEHPADDMRGSWDLEKTLREVDGPFYVHVGKDGYYVHDRRDRIPSDLDPVFVSYDAAAKCRDEKNLAAI